MKKLTALVALILSLVMLAVPMSAMAAPTTATIIQIANPSMSMDADIRSMPGLALQLALCEDAESSLVQIIADLFVNSQNATSAMLQIDSAMNLVGLIGGMSSAYTMNLEEGMAMADSELDALIAQVQPFVDSLETWTLPNDVIAIISNHFSSYAVTDKGVAANANGVELQYVNISGDLTNMIIDVMKAIETDSLILSFVELMTGYPMETLGLVEGSGIGGGNGLRMSADIGTDAAGSVMDLDADITAYSEGTDGGIIRVALDLDSSNIANVAANFALTCIDVASGETIMSLTTAANILENGFSVNGSIFDGYDTIPFNAALATGEAQDTFDLSMTIDENDSFTVSYVNNKSGATAGVIAASMTSVSWGDTTTISLDANYNVTDTGVKAAGKLVTNDPYSGVTTIALNDLTVDSATGLLNFDFSVSDPYSGAVSMKLAGNYAMTDAGIVITGNLAITDDYGTAINLTLNELSFDTVNGGFNASVSYSDEYTSPMTFTLALTPSAPVNGAIYSGLLAFTGFDGYSTIGASCEIHVLTAAVDTANFYIDPASAVDLMTMTEDQAMTAQTELNAIMQNIGNAIMNAYPHIFE